MSECRRCNVGEPHHSIMRHRYLDNVSQETLGFKFDVCTDCFRQLMAIVEREINGNPVPTCERCGEKANCVLEARTTILHSAEPEENTPYTLCSPCLDFCLQSLASMIQNMPTAVGAVAPQRAAVKPPRVYSASPPSPAPASPE